MRFLLDESADYPLAVHLRQLGHDATSIVRDYTRSISDDSVLAIAVRERRVVITNEPDFGTLVVRDRHAQAGVILFRLGNESLSNKIARLDAVLADHGHELDQLLVVTQHRIRVRRS